MTAGTLPPPSCTFAPRPATAPPHQHLPVPTEPGRGGGSWGGSALSHRPVGPGAASSFLPQSRGRVSRSANYVENWKKLHEPWWEMRSGLKVIGAAAVAARPASPEAPGPSPEAERGRGPLPTPEPRLPRSGGAASSSPPPTPVNHPVLENPEAKWTSLPPSSPTSSPLSAPQGCSPALGEVLGGRGLALGDQEHCRGLAGSPSRGDGGACVHAGVCARGQAGLLSLALQACVFCSPTPSTKVNGYLLSTPHVPGIYLSSSAVMLLLHTSVLSWTPELFPLLTYFCSPLRTLCGGPSWASQCPALLHSRAQEAVPRAAYTGPVELGGGLGPTLLRGRLAGHLG